MSKENWKNVFIAVLKLIKLIVDAILQKQEQKEATEKEISLLFEKE